MWIDQHPYLFIYLLGCASVLALTAFKVVLFWFVAWVTKANVMNKNLKKLDPVKDQSFGQKAALFVGILAFEMALSWINVAVAIWQIAVTLLKVLRDALTSTPEAIKLLRFPLANNPNMSQEAVWAYVYALRIRAGEKTGDKEELLFSLSSFHEEHSSFDRQAALNQLNGLNVLNGEVTLSASDRLHLDEEET